MKKYSKIIAVICSVLMCLSVCMFSVYADNESGAQPADPGQGSESQGSQGGGDQSDVPYVPEPDPGQGGGESQSSDVPYIPEQDPASSYDDGGQGGGYDNQTSYESSYNDGNSGSSVYYDSDGNSYSNQSDVYVGGGQSYQPPVSTAPPAALYDTDKKIDVKELSKNDWGDIAKLLKNSGQTDSSGGADDFAFIQKNTSKTDNGHWIIIAGIACITLSVVGFGYLIISNIIKRRKIKAGNISRSTPGKSANQYRSNDDYNDGYGSGGSKGSGYKKSAPKQAEKRSSSSRHSGGRRYR